MLKYSDLGLTLCSQKQESWITSFSLVFSHIYTIPHIGMNHTNQPDVHKMFTHSKQRRGRDFPESSKWDQNQIKAQKTSFNVDRNYIRIICGILGF